MREEEEMRPDAHAGRGRDAVHAEREEETVHAESEGRCNTVSARPWELRTSSLTKMSRECRTSPSTGTDGVSLKIVH